MEKTNLWPCPLDEKNLTTDWISEMLGDDKWMPTPQREKGLNEYLAFVKNTLVLVSWRFGSNQLTIIPQPTPWDLFIRERDDVYGYLIEAIDESLSYDKIKVLYHEDSDRIDFFFYWDNND